MKTYNVCDKVIRNMDKQPLCITISIFKDERLLPFESVINTKDYDPDFINEHLIFL